MLSLSKDILNWLKNYSKDIYNVKQIICLINAVFETFYL